MVITENQGRAIYNFSRIKWLIFFALSLSANIWLAMISQVNSLPAPPSVAATSLVMNFIPSQSVSGYATPYSSNANTAVKASKEAALPTLPKPLSTELSTELPTELSTELSSELPTKVLVQSVGEKSVNKPQQNNRADGDKKIPIGRKKASQKAQKNVLSQATDQQNSEVLLGHRNRQQHQLKHPLQGVSPTPDEQQHSQQELVKPIKGFVQNKERASHLDDPLSDENARLEGAAGLPGGEAPTKYSKAQYLRRDPPRYPERARTLGQEGTVVLHAEILPNGYSQQLKVAVSSGHQLLDGAALAAVKQWQFVPAYEQGYPVAHWVSVPVRFTLQ